MQPEIEVGIMFAPRISFVLSGEYWWEEKQKQVSGDGSIQYNPSSKNHKLILNGEENQVTLPLNFTPRSANASLELKDVVIGINFHWERKEDQKFTGGLRIIEEDEKFTAINILPLEDYLKSVISSEMNATCSPEFLKAHAVISRSWLIAQKDKEAGLKKKGGYQSLTETQQERIRWYDREDHHNFDVCADDHCQRYQGITRASTDEISRVIDQTRGEVLVYDNAICDARYSKCCGGITELFENVWEPKAHPYLVKVTDNDKEPDGFDTHLNTEEKAVKWIKNLPQAFCNTRDKQVLSQVLNDYDQETQDFYRWTKAYTQEEIRNLLKSRIDIDVGKVVELIPLERGTSGRLIKLKIVGTHGEKTIGKELEIRKAFSTSHLYSSAFFTEYQDLEDGIPQKFIFKGSGWGHGVGLCQIGAAVMGNKGYAYKDILMHYFKGAELKKAY